MNLRSYYVEGLENKIKYISFVRVMVQMSDAFSFVYFKYNERRTLRVTVKNIKQKLQPYKLYSKKTNILPSMFTLNESGHIYNLVAYKSVPEVVDILVLVDSLWDWDYPNYPMDLCFFKNGYAHFISSAHEEYSILYTDDKNLVQLLREHDIKLIAYKKMEKNELYYDSKTIW